MRYLICFIMMLAIAACGRDGCENAGGGTVARKHTQYKGNPSANLPYIETGKIYYRAEHSWVGLRPTIHNPTDQDIKAKISCQYWLDGAKAVNSKTTRDVTVRKQSSRVFEGFDYLVDNMSGRVLGVAARCTAIYSNGYSSNYSDASPVQ